MKTFYLPGNRTLRRKHQWFICFTVCFTACSEMYNIKPPNTTHPMNRKIPHVQILLNRCILVYTIIFCLLYKPALKSHLRITCRFITMYLTWISVRFIMNRMWKTNWNSVSTVINCRNIKILSTNSFIVCHLGNKPKW